MHTREIAVHDQNDGTSEFARYTEGISMSTVGKILHRTDRTVRDWKSGRRKIPDWAMAVLRVNFLEQRLIQEQMVLAAQLVRLDVKKHTHSRKDCEDPSNIVEMARQSTPLEADSLAKKRKY